MAVSKYVGRGGYRGGVRPTLGNIRRMVPEYATVEWIEKMRAIEAVLEAYASRAKGKDTRNYVELRRLLSEVEPYMDKSEK